MAYTVSFGPEANVYTGGGPGAVAVNSNGTIVVVMLTTTALVYSVGTVDPSNSTVSFPDSPDTAYAWDSGDMPILSFDVAIQDTGSQVVLVWQTGGGENKLYYRTGTLNGRSINWNPIDQFDKGMYPSVCIADTKVVEFHVSQEDDRKMYSHTGTLDGFKISGFDQSGTKFAGYNQEIWSTSCVITSNGWFLATITEGPPYGGTIVSYSATTLDSELTYEGSTTITSGGTSNVTLVSGGNLLELHELDPDDIHYGKIYLAQGVLDENGGSGYGQLSWQVSTSTSIKGARPDIAASGCGGPAKYIVMTYMSSDDTGSTKARCVTLS